MSWLLMKGPAPLLGVRVTRPWLRQGRWVGCLAALVALLSTAACGLSDTNTGGYLAGNGAVRVFPASDRGVPVKLSGPTLDGGTFTLTPEDGKLTVVNAWWSGCGPCMKEAPMLEEAYKELKSSVQFVGISMRETSAVNAISFNRKNSVTYPSIYSPSGEALSGFPKGRTLATLPSTAILDGQGRVAALFDGQIPSETELTEVIQCVATNHLSSCEMR